MFMIQLKSNTSPTFFNRPARSHNPGARLPLLLRPAGDRGPKPCRFPAFLRGQGHLRNLPGSGPAHQDPDGQLGQAAGHGHRIPWRHPGGPGAPAVGRTPGCAQAAKAAGKRLLGPVHRYILKRRMQLYFIFSLKNCPFWNSHTLLKFYFTYKNSNSNSSLTDIAL